MTPWILLEQCTQDQRGRLAAYERMLLEWNERVNLISRATAPADVYERHILHSLALTRRSFPAGAIVVDFGTGGGLPGLPLAICFPSASFHLVDSTLKKLRAVEDMAARLGLANVHVHHSRAERWKGKAHYAVSRATAPLWSLWQWFERVRQPLQPFPEDAWTPGLLCLKGGDLRDEIDALTSRRDVRVESMDLRLLLGPAYFEEKALLHVRDIRS